GELKEKLCKLQKRYSECLVRSALFANCNPSHTRSRLEAATNLLKADYHTNCEKQIIGKQVHGPCRKSQYLVATKHCDHVFDDDSILFKEKIFKNKKLSRQNPYMNEMIRKVCHDA